MTKEWYSNCHVKAGGLLAHKAAILQDMALFNSKELVGLVLRL
jgi:hypothetical protein